MHPQDARMQCIMKLESRSVTASGYRCCEIYVRSFVESLLLLRA
jgi:hypothetical protein